MWYGKTPFLQESPHSFSLSSGLLGMRPVLEEVFLDLGLLSPFHDRTLLHLYALNRGVLITPFHNMALMAPTTPEAQVDRHTAVFVEAPYKLVD